MSERQSHPIADGDLDKHIPEAESVLGKVKGTQDLQGFFIEALSSKEKHRVLPEAQALLFAVRRGLCFYYLFVDMLINSTKLKDDVSAQKAGGAAGSVTPTIQKKMRFVSAYAMFVMASYIAGYCQRELKGKSATSPALNMQWKLTAGNGWANDVKYLFLYYIETITAMKPEGGKIVTDIGDMLAASKFYFETVATRAIEVCKEAAEFMNLVDGTTFRNNGFGVTGLSTENREEGRIITFAAVRPEEVVGNNDVKIMISRLCGRIALYDASLRKNPFQDFGGIVPSALLDGPPGTGKTSIMRMAMTMLRDLAEMVGLPSNFQSLTADQVKTEWYGKTAQLIKEFLANAQDPFSLTQLNLDDIDLLLSAERSVSGGADNDIMKALMDFFAGTTSVWTGNYFTIAATNRPTSSDSALRQRFVYRANLLGPQTWEEYADLAALQLKGFAKTGLLKIGAGKYRPLTRELPRTLAVAYGEAILKKHRSGRETWDDIGALCAEFRKQDPEFTGRAAANAIQVAVMQAADFDVPQQWFENPEAFRSKPWEERLQAVKELYKPLTGADIMMALENQFSVEQRYREEARRRKVIELAQEFAARTAALAKAQTIEAEYKTANS